tara:strand:- start:5156 stop:6037 length:882 start_codon:yes stop_codon:yes gene_type:complete
MKILLLFLLFLPGCESLFFQDFKIKTLKNKSEEGTLYYKVKKGDNLYSISRKFRVSIPKLVNFNNINSPYKIFPNQKIFIPKKRIHIVQKGETLYSISRRYKTDLFTISKSNKIRNVNQINVNQRLVIPDYFLEKNKRIVKVNKQKQQNLKKTRNKKKKSNLKSDSKDFKTKFIWPVKGKVISKYGSENPGFFNDGINIKSLDGQEIKASSDGEIVYSGNEIPGYGNLILIRHSKNWITAYAHLKKIYKKKGTLVKKGEFIGSVGKSGNVQEPQLHFEIRKGKEAVNPMNYLS